MPYLIQCEDCSAEYDVVDKTRFPPNFLIPTGVTYLSMVHACPLCRLHQRHSKWAYIFKALREGFSRAALYWRELK